MRHFDSGGPTGLLRNFKSIGRVGSTLGNNINDRGLGDDIAGASHPLIGAAGFLATG